MTIILQVLLGLALANYLMFDVVLASSKPAASVLQKALLIAGATAAALMPALLASAVLEWLLIARYTSDVLAVIGFCVILAAVVQGVCLLSMRRNMVTLSALPVLTLLIFGNCVVIGLTMPPDAVGAGVVLTAGLLRSAAFALILTGFALFRERLAGADVPVGLRGAPATFIAAAFLSMIFMGFAGLA